MRDACIHDGDSIAADRALTAINNRVIVARFGNGFTLKRLQLIKGSRGVFLKSKHPTYLASKCRVERISRYGV